MIQCICIFSGFCFFKWLFSVLDWCCRQGGQNLPGDRMVKWIQRIWFWNYRSKHAEFYFSHFDWLSVFLLHIILTLYVQVLKRLSDEIGESLLASLFTFFLISIQLSSYKPWLPYIWTIIQKLKYLINFSNLCNFQLFASNVEGNISHRKLWNCWITKKWTMCYYILCKILSF